MISKVILQPRMSSDVSDGATQVNSELTEFLILFYVMIFAKTVAWKFVIFPKFSKKQINLHQLIICWHIYKPDYDFIKGGCVSSILSIGCVKFCSRLYKNTYSIYYIITLDDTWW